ncbi:alpha/beta fold hydrolase, partial [Acetobacter sp. AN02]|uniref:alpha/beta fold hydrolase n=1 Tax=Acetobacter sp. AN02 TaxID=2894186 RepID=UPI0024345F43
HGFTQHKTGQPQPYDPQNAQPDRLLDIFVKDSGPDATHSPSLLLIHGFGSDTSGWMLNHNVLAEKRRVIAADLPGHGRSSKIYRPGDRGFLARVVSGVLDAMDIPRVHVAAHSLGAVPALGLARVSPARVASLSLIAPAGFNPDINADFIGGFLHTPDTETLLSALETLVFNPRLISRRMAASVLEARQQDGAAECLSAIANDFFPSGHQSFSGADIITRFQGPVQIIQGTEDRIISPVEENAFPVRCHSFPETGHLPHMERAAEVNRILSDFLGSCSD